MKKIPIFFWEDKTCTFHSQKVPLILPPACL